MVCSPSFRLASRQPAQICCMRGRSPTGHGCPERKEQRNRSCTLNYGIGSTSETSCTAISDRAPGSTSRSSACVNMVRSRTLTKQLAERCCCPRVRRLRPKRFRSRARRRISVAASTTQSSCLRITLNADPASGAEPPQARELVKRPLPANVGFVVASPRFEPANPSRRNCEERHALQKKSRGRLKQFAQCVVMERPLMALNGQARYVPHALAEMAQQQTRSPSGTVVGSLSPSLARYAPDHVPTSSPPE